MFKKALLLASILLTLWQTPLLSAQTALPPAEPDSEAFIATNFILQDSYTNVLCVFDETPCPAQIETAVPCLVTACDHPTQTYTINLIFPSLQEAGEAAQGGDLVIIMPGTYEGLALEEMGGADGAYIHFLGWGEPGSVVVDDTAFPDEDWLLSNFYFIDAHHYIIQNIAFEDAEKAGILISGYFEETGHFSHHVIVMGVYSHDNGLWGLHSTSTNVMLVQDSYFLDNLEHGVYLSGSGDNVLVRRNVFQGNTGAGLQINADPQSATYNLANWISVSADDSICGISLDDADADGPATWQDVKRCYDSLNLPDLGDAIEDGISQYAIVEQNVITNNGEAGGAGINLASLRNSLIRNNLIYGNDAAGIACWDNAYAEERGLDSSEFGCWDVHIFNNTIVDESGGRGALIISVDARKMQVYNNIIIRDRFDAYEIRGNSSEGLRSGSNYYFAQFINPPLDSNPEERSITGFSIEEALDQFVDPNFDEWVFQEETWVIPNADRPDFHPEADSILLTGGNPAYSSALDFFGNPRTRSEIGALAAP